MASSKAMTQSQTKEVKELHLATFPLKSNKLFSLLRDIFDPTVGNRSQTCDLLDNPYVHPHPHQGVGDRIDYILYRSRHDNVQCLESYHTLHKVPNHPQNLHYSDHLAVYARFEIPENLSHIQPKLVEDVETLDEETHNDLRSACIVVEESIQRLQRHRFYCLLCAIFLVYIFISFNGNALSNGYVYTIFLILKNLLCLLGLSISIWFIAFGKPVERNALSAIRNAMHIRLRVSQFQF